MNRRLQERGELDWSAEDLIELQSEPLKAIDGIFGAFNNCVISGCEKVGSNMNAGVVIIDSMVMPFNATLNISFPCYIIPTKTDIQRHYLDGLHKPISHNYVAKVSQTKPTTGGYITVPTTGVESLLRKASDAVDSDSSTTVATSKALANVNKKIIPTPKARTTEGAEISIDPETGKMYAPNIDELTTIASLQTVNKTLPGAVNELHNGKAKIDLSNVALSKNMASNGYYKAPDGLMIQWGLGTGISGHYVYFPISFLSVYSVVTTITYTLSAWDAVISSYISSMSTSGFYVYKRYVEFSRDNGSVYRGGGSEEPFYWIAIGRWK